MLLSYYSGYICVESTVYYIKQWNKYPKSLTLSNTRMQPTVFACRTQITSNIRFLQYPVKWVRQANTVCATLYLKPSDSSGIHSIASGNKLELLRKYTFRVIFVFSHNILLSIMYGLENSYQVLLKYI
jgi:hypothetical protein